MGQSVLSFVIKRRFGFFLVIFPALSREISLPADRASTQVFGMAEIGGALCRRVLWDAAFGCSTNLAQAGSGGVGAPNWRVTLVF